MSPDEPPATVDPDLLADWVEGWTLARGTPPPVVDSGGLRVDVGWPEQRTRYVFAGLTPGLSDLAERVDQPYVLLKACVSPDDLRAFLPARWRVKSPGFLMTAPEAAAGAPPTPPQGFVLDLGEEAGVTVVRLREPGGDTAAIGRLVRVGETAIYDRIETAEAWRRRGLARAVMQTLQALARERGATRGVLVATADGRRLYEALGWRLHSLYSTAELRGG